MPDEKPFVPSQTIAQNEAIETTLIRLKESEIYIPQYQRDSDEWDNTKKSLFIESVLNRLTIPGFYLAQDMGKSENFEVIDGQQRLTTLLSFFNNEFTLLDESKCPYFSGSVHYAGKKFDELDDHWKRAFRRYNLTLVTLPDNMPLSLRLEIFRRINQGGTPLSAQDIRLGYYSQGKTVGYIQRVGIYDIQRTGAKRMLSEDTWPWEDYADDAESWSNWWKNTKTSTGQTASKMFLWYLTAKYHDKLNTVLNNKKHLTGELHLHFSNSTEEALDVFCAQLQYEQEQTTSAMLCDYQQIQTDFNDFRVWWANIRNQCATLANVQNYRNIALLMPGLCEVFDNPRKLTESQWGWLGRFISKSRKTAGDLNIEFPEAKGKWNGAKGQFEQIKAFFNVAKAIKNK